MAVLPVILLLLTLAGIVLVMLAWRGRRVNDHPHCTGCGFDLLGVYPASPTCPECGAGLARKHGTPPVRIGKRARRPVLMGVGLAILLMPALSAGLLLNAAVSGASAARQLPLAGLDLMSRYASQARADEAAVELTSRLVKGSLDPAQTARIVELALWYQGQAQRPWTRPWADLLERCRLSGLTNEQEQRIIDQALTDLRIKLITRPNVARGTFAAIDLDFNAPRLATNQELDLRTDLRDWQLTSAGVTLTMPQVVQPMRSINDDPREPFDPGAHRRRVWFRTVTLAGPSNKIGVAGATPNNAFERRILRGTPISADAPLGEATISVEVDLYTGDAPAVIPNWSVGEREVAQPLRIREAAARSNGVKPGTLTAQARVTVVRAVSEVIAGRVLTGEALTKFENALRPQKVTLTVNEFYYSAQGSMVSASLGQPHPMGGEQKRYIRLDWSVNNQGGAWWTGQWDLRDAPEGAAFDVTIQIDEQSVAAGSIPQPYEQPGLMTRAYYAPRSTKPIVVPASRFATVLLTPSRALAESWVHVTWIHDAPIVFKDVPVEVVDNRRQKIEPLEGLVDTTDTIRPARFLR